MGRLVWALVGFCGGVAMARNAAPMPGPVVATVFVVGFAGCLLTWWFGRRYKAEAVATAVAVARAEAVAQAEAVAVAHASVVADLRAQAAALAQVVVNFPAAPVSAEIAGETKSAAIRAPERPVVDAAAPLVPLDVLLGRAVPVVSAD